MQNSQTGAKDILLWTAVALCTAGAFFGTYSFNFSAPIIALIWIGWALVAFGLGFFTRQGIVLAAFAKEAKTELEKVVWPNRQETTQTTATVVIMVTVAGFVLWGIDSCMIWAIGKLTHLS